MVSPAGLPTYNRPNTDSRSTINYIFGHTTLATRLANRLIHRIPALYTDHRLLTTDLLPDRDDRMLEICAQQYMKGSESRQQNKTALLRKQRMLALKDNVNPTTTDEIRKSNEKLENIQTYRILVRSNLRPICHQNQVSARTLLIKDMPSSVTSSDQR
ncbi:hypothetical protein MFLAVUS_003036 [Mucor flavus]|uniref:Uncharacterized protein n=1 Tax=Mucor flavus TaxID=439312 RepID=A0ABP9YRY5_9FUNG